MNIGFTPRFSAAIESSNRPEALTSAMVTPIYQDVERLEQNKNLDVAFCTYGNQHQVHVFGVKKDALTQERLDQVNSFPDLQSLISELGNDYAHFSTGISIYSGDSYYHPGTIGHAISTLLSKQ